MAMLIRDYQNKTSEKVRHKKGPMMRLDSHPSGSTEQCQFIIIHRSANKEIAVICVNAESCTSRPTDTDTDYKKCLTNHICIITFFPYTIVLLMVSSFDSRQHNIVMHKEAFLIAATANKRRWKQRFNFERKRQPNRDDNEIYTTISREGERDGST